jgi:23S rRNA pseudouridine2604 synthase
MSEAGSIRINKYLSESGFCSRRMADQYIEEGRVTINDRIPDIGTKVMPGDVVKVDGKHVLEPRKEHVYIAFNKPPGIVCTTDTRSERNNIIDYIGFPERIFPIGRLDKASEGLIFLTSDGDIVNKILRAGNNHEKEYIVRVDQPLTDDFLYQMSNGVPILDTVTAKCEIEQFDDCDFSIILKQGMNRQIRRMCEHLGYEVLKLRRIRIMNIELDIPLGHWRYLSDLEMKEIMQMTANSSKTYEEPD